MKTILLSFAMGVPLFASPVFAADTLPQWAATIDQRDVQQKILGRIFGADIGPASDAILNKETGVYLFPKSGSWVRLGKDFVSGTVGGQPYLVVSCMFYNRSDQPPVNASSYLFRNVSDRPVAISGGYASHESVQAVKLPKIGQTFLAIVDSSEQSGPTQWSAFLMTLEASGRPRSIWNSPMAIRRFQFGFDTLGGKAEKLVFKAMKGGDTQYSAFSWNGTRFEPDSFASDSQIKALPDDVWSYGAGL